MNESDDGEDNYEEQPGVGPSSKGPADDSDDGEDNYEEQPGSEAPLEDDDSDRDGNGMTAAERHMAVSGQPVSRH